MIVKEGIIMKGYKRYWILAGFIVISTVGMVLSLTQQYNIKRETVPFHAVSGLEDELFEGTYYIYRTYYKSTNGFTVKDYSSSFSLHHALPQNDFDYTETQFDVYNDQNTMNIDSILNEYPSTEEYGFAFATFEVEQSGIITIDTDVTISDTMSELYGYRVRFSLSQTHPREIVTWETINKVSEIMLVVSLIAVPVVIFFSPKK